MKLIISIMVLFFFSACDSKNGDIIGSNVDNNSSNPSNSLELSHSKVISDYNITDCKSDNKNSSECQDISNKFNLKENIVSILSDKKVGVMPYESFNSKNYLIVPKGESKISAINALAYGFYLYKKDNKPLFKSCECYKKVPYNSYSEAKQFLQEKLKLTGTDEQERAILAFINRNLDYLGNSGLKLKDSYFLAVKALAENFLYKSKNDNYIDLSGLKVKLYGKNILTTLDNFEKYPPKLKEFSPFTITLNDIVINDTITGLNLPIYHIYANFKCSENEVKHLDIYGINDNFYSGNSEVPFYIGSGFDKYDRDLYFKVLKEKLVNLSSSIVNAKIVFGIKKLEKFNNPKVYIQNIEYTYNDIVNNWNRPLSSVPIYMNDLPLSLINNIQGGNSSFDIKFLNGYNVDFIALMSCQKQDLTSFSDMEPLHSCKDSNGEQLINIVAGNDDDFASPEDSTNPTSSLLNLYNSYTLYQYDQPVREGAVIDSINIPTGLQYTQANLLINTKSTIVPAYNGDIINIMGDANFNNAISIDPNSVGISTINGGVVHSVYGGGGSSLLNLINNSTSLDIATIFHTEVDAIKLSLCAKKIEDNGGDISIDKNITNIEYENGSARVVYQIDFNGTLPAGETFSFEDIVPNSTIFTNINAPSPWQCTPSPTIPSNAILNCEIPPQANNLNPIPSIEIVALSKLDGNLTNCASIVEGNNSYFNNDTTNDKSCISVDLNLTDSEICNNSLYINLSNNNYWSNSNGDHPTINNIFNGDPWDPNMIWFNFGDDGNSIVEYRYKIDFCACEATAKIKNFKSDNYGKLYFDNDPNPTSFNEPSYIVYRNIFSQDTMASWGTVESGFGYIPYNSTPTNHTLNLVVKNIDLESGAAIDGELYIKGHIGKCR